MCADAPRQRQRQGQGQACSRVNRQAERYACLPSVMTDFRKVLQAHTPMRPPLPAPAAAHGSSSGSGGKVPTLPPLPAATAAAASGAGLLGAIPSVPAGIYAAAGTAAGAALRRWDELAGYRAAELAPAGSGRYDPRSAVPFGMGEEQAVRRLRYYLGLEDSDGRSGHSVRAQGQSPPLEGYQDNRMLVGSRSTLSGSPWPALSGSFPRFPVLLCASCLFLSFPVLSAATTTPAISISPACCLLLLE